MLILSVAVSLAFGLALMFVVLAMGRAASPNTDGDQLSLDIDKFLQSEIISDRKEKLEADPKTWNGYWFNLIEKTGRKPATVEQPARFALIAIILAAAIGLLIFPGGMLGLFAAPILVAVVLRTYLVHEATQRSATLNKQLPGMISSLSANINAGRTAIDALVDVADETPSPLGDELKIMKSELQVGVELNVALDKLSERVPSRDVKFLVSAIKIANSSGTHLGKQLRVIDHIITSRTRLQQKLETAISSVNPTIWVSALTIPAMFIGQFISSPDNQAFWFTLQGVVCLIVVAFMYSGGLYISKRMVKGVRNA